MMKVRSDFEIVANVPDKAIAIVDLNRGRMSITNDAEAVVDWLTGRQFLSPGKRLVYRDSDGRWDELKHDGAGRFLGFAPIGCTGDQSQVLAAIGC